MRFLLKPAISIFISCCFYLNINTCIAQRLPIRVYSVKEGLPQSQVQTILQDGLGYLWVGTADGMARFDGSSFTTYTKKDGLFSNYIHNSFIDAEGDLWLSHRTNGLSRIRVKTKDIECVPVPPAMASSYIQEIYQDSSGTYWFATAGQGIFTFDGQNWQQLTTLNGLCSNHIYAIFQSVNGDLWFGTENGISIYQESQEKNRVFLTLSTKDGLPNNYITSLIADRKGNIWVGTEMDGLCKISRVGSSIKEWQFEKYSVSNGLSSNNIQALYEDRSGRIWIATLDNGVTIYTPPTDLSQSMGTFSILTLKHGLSYRDVKAIFQDMEGSYWIGTNGGGLCQFWDKRFEFFGEQEGFINDAIWVIREDRKGNFWFGSEKGLIKYCPTDDKSDDLNITNFTRKHGLRGDEVDAIYEDEQGILWLGVHGLGVQKYDPTTNAFSFFSAVQDDQILSIIPDKKGNLWFGSNGGGLYRYNLATAQVDNFNVSNGLPSNDVFALLVTEDNKLWIATRDGGIVSYDGDEFRLYTEEDGFNSNSALSITNDSSGNIWIGTAGDGIFKYDGYSFTNYFVDEGFSGDDAYFLICDNDNNLWQGTRRGVERFNPETGEVKLYDRYEGFKAVETNQNAVYKDRSGKLWFGSIDGAIRYNPEEDLINSAEPLVYINKAKYLIGENPAPADNRFSFKHNHLTFNYIALSFVCPEKIRYKYKLEGLDEDWYDETELSYARYANLAPGKYTFRVKAKNNDGIWSSESAVYEFEILTPFWRTIWFFSLIILFLAVAVYGVHWRHVRKIQKDNIRLDLKIQQRTKQLVTEKEKAQNAYEALCESEERYRQLIELSPDAIIVHIDGTIEYVNKAGVALFGANKPEDLVSKPLFDLAHPDYVEIARERIRRIYKEKKEAGIMRQKMLRLDGSSFDVEVLGAPISYMGKDAGQSVVRDITERKKAEDALIQEKERLAVTLSSIEDAVVTTDIDGKIILINDKAQTLIGIIEDECIGKLFSTVIRINRNERPIDPIERVLSQGVHINYHDKTLLESNGGTIIPIEFSAAPIQNSDKQTIGAVTAFRDITDRKRMEAELLKSQKLESIGLLAGGIAHDFNNILTAIVGNISLAKMYSGESEVNSNLVKAEKAALQAKELTQQLLTFSKGGAPIKETASIYEIVHESASFILRGSEIQSEFLSPPDLWNVDVDPGQISQVIQNLIINAEQAMPEGKKIFISLKNKILDENSYPGARPGNYVRIAIRDEGVGIPEKHLPRIFDPYFTTKKKGSGLGLTTTYSIIKRHDGHITVSSISGVGTIVKIFLPASIKSISEKKRREAFMCNGKGRILVMDDEEMVLELIGQVLEHLGYTVFGVKDGESAIEEYKKAKAENRPYDIVIMDLTIPGGLGGKDAIKSLKEIDPEVKAIVSSGYSNDPIMANYKNYGFAARLGKPYQIETLSATIVQLLKNSS